MKIQIIDNKQNHIVAQETDGDGLFKLNGQKEVIYQNSADNKKWFVNSNLEHFKSSIDIFHWYLDTVITFQTEEEQSLIVAEFKKKIFDIEFLGDASNAYWNIIIEQAEAGHL